MTRRIQRSSALVFAVAVLLLGAASSAVAQVCTTVAARAKTGSIELQWPAVAGATSVAVKRGTSLGGPFATIATLPGASTVHADTPVPNNVLFYYRVEATTATGVCSSNVVAATAPAARTAVVPVPDVVGDAEAAARAEIVAARLAVGAVTQASSGTVATGLVISQNPPAGSSLPANTPVALVVSTGASDTTAPTVTINQAAAQADPTATSPIVFTVVFSEAVTGFATGDVTLGGTAGATTATVSGSGASYSVSVSGMTTAGTVTASIAAGVAQDGASLGNVASTSSDNTVTFDNVRPSVTINQAAAQADPAATSPIVFTVVFSEAVTGFATGDVTLGGTAGATTATVSGSGASYSVSVSGMTTAGTVTASIGAGVAQDAVGNTNLASTSNDNTVTYQTDTTAPTVTINQAAAQVDPTANSPIVFTVVFSEAVTGFATGDVTLGGTAGATTATVSGSGASYSVSVSGMTTAGTVTASIAAGVAQDSAGLVNVASTSSDNTVTYQTDTTAPTVTINQAAAQVDPTANSPIVFTVVFSEAVTGFATGDVTLGGTAGATTATVSGSGASYSVSVSGMTTAGTVVASIAAGVAQDGAGLVNVASTSSDNTVTFDNVRPSVTINQAAAQADPTATSPIVFTVVFSEAVTGFATGDVTLGGTAGATTATVSGSGASYSVSVSGMTTGGTVTASIGAGVAQDVVGNTNLASSSTDNTVTFDSSAPTVTINQAAAQTDPTATSPIVFTVVFSEAVTGFATGDVTLGGTAGATTATVSGSGASYSVSVSGMTTAGTVTASIAAGVAQDGAGLGNVASTSSDNTVTFDNVRPSVTINQAAAQADPAGGSPVVFTVVFSEPVTGFAGPDVTQSGTSLATTVQVSGSGASYSVSLSGLTTAGTVIVSIPASAAQDAAGNTNLASTSTDNTVTFAPQVSVPNVLNLTQEAATTAIVNAGLVVGVVTEAHDATVPIGQVASQAPLGGASAAVGSGVDLVISLGPSGGGPESLSLNVSQALVGGGGTIDITPTVLGPGSVEITPTPPVTYSIIAGVGATGTLPGINGAQVTTSPNTRGNYTLRGTVTGTTVIDDVLFTVVDGAATSTNVGKLVKLSASENRAANALADLLDALEENNLGAVVGINAALQAARNLSPITGPNTVRRSAAVAPETGFLPTPARLQANGYLTTAGDTAFGNLLPQITSKVNEIAAFYNTLSQASATDSVAQLATLNSQLQALRDQLFGLTITPRGVVNNASSINAMMANNFPEHLHAVGNRVNAVLQEQGLLVQNLRPNQFFGPLHGGDLAQSPAAFYNRNTPAFFGLIGLIGGSSLQMKLVNEIYGEIMQEVTRMMVILIADGLIDSYTNFARLEGITTGGSLSFHAFGLPGSTVEGSGMNTAFLSRNEVFLVGPAQVSAVQNAASDCNPTNWENLQDAYDCFDAIVNGLGDSYELAHQPPSSISFGCVLDIFDEHSGCTTLNYDAGFDDVNDTRFPSPVIVLYHNLDTGSRSFGTFNFVP